MKVGGVSGVVRAATRPAAGRSSSKKNAALAKQETARLAPRPKSTSGTKNKIGVFISYTHEDIRIANTLRQCLGGISPDIEAFIDHTGLISGEEYEPALARNIADSQWFLMICSGPPRAERDMGWCLLEAGQFRAKLLGEGEKQDVIQSRLVTIHDSVRPGPVSKFQSIKISSRSRTGMELDLTPGSADHNTVEETDAFRLFHDVVKYSLSEPLVDLGDAIVRENVREQARRLVRSFIDNAGDPALPEIVLQPRISFYLPSGAASTKVALPNDSVITGYESSLKELFGILGTETTWGDIKCKLKGEDESDPLWITDIEDAAVQVAKGNAPGQPAGLCLTMVESKAVKFYRVLFARYIPYASKAKTCYVTFIPSRPRQFEVKRRSSILLSAIILSIRFRQRILPYENQMQERSRAKRVDSLYSLERTLHQVETEAIEFGLDLGAEEDAPILQYIDPGEDYDFMEKCMSDWGASRSLIGDAILAMRMADSEAAQSQALDKAEEIVVEELRKIKLVNGRFIKILTDALSAGEQLDGES